MGRKGSKRRGNRAVWCTQSRAWQNVLRAARSDTHLDGAADSGLKAWLRSVCGDASLLTFSCDDHGGAGTDPTPARLEEEQDGFYVPRAPDAPQPKAQPKAKPQPKPQAPKAAAPAGELRQAGGRNARAERVAAVQLCMQAFQSAKLKMEQDFWVYEAGKPAALPPRMQDVPYLEAAQNHKKLVAAGLEAQRMYLLYTHPGRTEPTAAIVLETPADSVWIVAIMGSTERGHGRAALQQLIRLAFEGRQTWRVLVLEALNGATPKGRKLVEFYKSCGFTHRGDSPPPLTPKKTSGGGGVGTPRDSVFAVLSEPQAAGLSAAAAAELREFFGESEDEDEDNEDED